jgi:hypothetical protein
LLLTEAGDYTLALVDGGVPGIAPTVGVQVTQGTAVIATPHPAKSYPLGVGIPLNSVVKSTVSKVIPLTGTANIVDQNGNVLGTAVVGATGLLHFLLNDVGAGVYTCHANYLGDTNHGAAASGTFTLTVLA